MPELDLAHQPWLEHAMTMALEPGRDALRRGRHVSLDRRAVYAAAYAVGRLQAWYDALQTTAPVFLAEIAAVGVADGRASYTPTHPVG